MPIYEGSGLRLRARSFVALTLTVEYLTLDQEGQEHWNRQDWAIPSGSADGSLNTFVAPLQPGLFLYGQVSTTDTVRHGDCYCILNMIADSRNSASPNIATFIERYVTTFSPAFFPGSPFEGTTDGTPSHIIYNPTNPAAGNNLVVVVPANQLWRIKTFDFQFVTSAAVANRVMSGYFRQSGGGNRFVAWGVPASVVQAASLTFQYSGSINYGPINYAFSTNDIGTTEPIVIPDVILYPNESFETIIASIQAADQIQSVYMYIERWVTP